MKKSSLIISILLVISLVILMLSFADKNRNDKNEINKIDYISNVEFTSEVQLLAIAYLNNMEEISSKYISNFENIKVYQTTGEGTYLIIPRYDNVEIKIYKISLNGDTLVKDEIIATTKMPFVITCNVSDIMFEIKYNENVFEYSPSLNLEDNSLNTNEYVLDITK